MQKSRAIQHQATEKGLLQPKTRQQRQRKPDAIFAKKAKIENAHKHAAPAITTFFKNFRKLFAFNAITNKLKLIVSVVNICSILNAL